MSSLNFDALLKSVSHAVVHRSRLELMSSQASVIMNSRSSTRVRGWRLNTFSFTTPQKKKSNGVKSGDRGGHSILLRRPIHLPGNVASKNSRTRIAATQTGPHSDTRLFHLSCHGQVRIFVEPINAVVPVYMP